MKFFLSIFSLVLMTTYALAAEEAATKVVTPKAAIGNNGGYGNSYSNGYGNGYGNSYGNGGYGSSYGNGFGNGGYGNGYGNSYGNGYGNGFGSGFGNSYGNGGFGNMGNMGSFGFGIGNGRGSCRTLDAMVFARNRAIQPLQQARQTCQSVNNLERVIDTLDIMINSLASQNKGCSYALNNDNRHFYSKK